MDRHHSIPRILAERLEIFRDLSGIFFAVAVTDTVLYCLPDDALKRIGAWWTLALVCIAFYLSTYYITHPDWNPLKPHMRVNQHEDREEGEEEDDSDTMTVMMTTSKLVPQQ